MLVTLLDLNQGRTNAGIPALEDAIRETGHQPRTVDVRGGLPEVLHPVVVSGGYGDPHDPGPWQAELRRFLRDQLEAGLPLFTVCFGFQILAIELGAEVRRLEQAREGLYPLTPVNGWLEPMQVFEQRSFGVWGLDPLALGPEGDVTAARLGEQAWGTVFHPEARPSDLAEKGLDTRDYDGSVRERTLLRFLRSLPA